MLSDAEIIELARALWPGLTVDAASDAFLLAWLPQLRRRVDLDLYGEDYDTAIAHLVAHQGYKVDPSGVLGTGGASAAGRVTSTRTGQLAASFSDPSADATGADYDLRGTVPGQAFLAIRDSLAGLVPMMVSL